MDFQVEIRDDHIFIRTTLETLSNENSETLSSLLEEYPKENVILHLLSVRSIRQQGMLEKTHNHRKKNDASFIVILNNALMDKYELTTAYTESQAYEILEMEKTER